MSEGKGIIGGFAASNTGNIEDCYCITEFNGKQFLSGGFIGENKGKIVTSFCEFGNKGLSGGFTGSGSTQIKNSFFFHNLDEDDKKLKDLLDIEREKKILLIKDNETAAELGYDTEKIWTYTGHTPLLKFQDAHWLFPVKLEPQEENVITISNEEQLFDFAEKVNNGNRKYATAKVILKSNINLHGKSWTPIGEDNGPSFEGIFDGNGYSIENFVVKDKNLSYYGFFGHLKGEVYNLSVDCVIQGLGILGGIAAVNSGTIGCCGAVIKLKAKGNDLKAGGLVGINKGHIFQSYAAGTMRFVIFPIFLFASIVGILCLLFAGVGIVHSTLTKKPGIYSPVPPAPDQIKIEGEESVEQVTGVNHVSFQFEERVSVDLASGLCTLHFKNPGDSNHRIVIQLQMTDTNAIAAMGSTGRSASEQAKREARSDYNPNNERVIIAESGAVDPGYRLDAIKLTDFAQENLTPGEYQAIVFLVPYSTENNGKAMLETQLPVIINVK